MAPPNMVTFDAPTRETCIVRENRTNTPLQALVTLNDPVYVEAAQALARLIVAAGESAEAKVRDGFQRVLSRAPSAAEIKHVISLYENARANYRQKPTEAAALIADPENPLPPPVDTVELAAWTAVANVPRLDRPFRRS